ncbi:MAG: ATP-binding protein [Burkholderiaceae bacterium]
MITTLEKAKSWDELQSRMYMDNMRRATTAIVPQTLMMIVGFGSVSTTWLAVMSVLMIGLHVARWLMTDQGRLAIDASARRAQTVINQVHWISVFHGVWIGLAALVLLPKLDPGWATVFSIIILGMQAGAVATTTVYPPTFMIWTLPIFLGFSAGWWRLDNDAGLVIPPLYLLFALVLFGAVRNAHATLRSSYDLRVERNEALLRADEANRQKAKFLATASHDLRQPAAALAFMSEELSEAKVDQSLKPVVNAIKRSSDNINSLIDTLFDLSKLDRALIDNHPQWLSLSELTANLRSIIMPKAATKGLTLNINCIDGHLLADPSHIQRWLGNLLDNAVKYTDKGSVNLDVELVAEGLQVSVSDTGRGIPADQLQNIWADYYRAEQSSSAGTFSLGLGLSIVKRLSELLGVSPKIESVEGQGTQITSVFPRESYRESLSQVDVQRATGRLESAIGKSLLLVEDDPDVAEALERHLSTLGFSVDLATDAKAARARLDSDVAYALMLTDNRLPAGEFGLELCSYANQADRTLPCLIVSADDIAANLVPTGFPLRRLKKPVQTNQLRAHLIQLLADPSTHASGRSREQGQTDE